MLYVFFFLRELLDNVLTDSSHPIKATIDVMQEKVTSMINNAMINEKSESPAMLFDDICKGIFNFYSKLLFDK